MDFSSLTQYTIEGTGSLVLAVIAYKIYKLRIATSSSCCGDHIKIKTVSRGDSQTDLELTPHTPPSTEQINRIV